jgi:hypothetical protein
MKMKTNKYHFSPISTPYLKTNFSSPFHPRNSHIFFFILVNEINKQMNETSHLSPHFYIFRQTRV